MSLADQALTQLFANAISSASLLLVGFVDDELLEATPFCTTSTPVGSLNKKSLSTSHIVFCIFKTNRCGMFKCINNFHH